MCALIESLICLTGLIFKKKESHGTIDRLTFFSWCINRKWKPYFLSMFNQDNGEVGTADWLPLVIADSEPDWEGSNLDP